MLGRTRTRLGGKWKGTSSIIEHKGRYQLFVGGGGLAPKLEFRSGDISTVVLGQGMGTVPVKVMGHGGVLAEFDMRRDEAQDFADWVRDQHKPV